MGGDGGHRGRLYQGGDGGGKGAQQPGLPLVHPLDGDVFVSVLLAQDSDLHGQPFLVLRQGHGCCLCLHDT